MYSVKIQRKWQLTPGLMKLYATKALYKKLFISLLYFRQEIPQPGRYKMQVTGHRSGHRSQVRSQVTGHRSQGTGHRAQVTGHRAQGTGHRAQKTQ